MINWAQVTGFDWDEGNSRKNAEKHGVSQSEAEEIFFNEPLLVLDDSKHSQTEARFHALGETDDERLLHPEFKTEAEEREFWETHDSTDYLDWNQAKPASFPKLKPSTKTISLRLPETLLDRIKIEANKRDMPYQSLIKAWLADDVNDSRRT